MARGKWKSLKKKQHTLYAIHPVGVDNIEDYYIGVSSRPAIRWEEHKEESIKGKGYLVHQKMREQECAFTVLEEGTEEDIYTREYELRPEKGIGWNLAIGGVMARNKSFPRKITSKLRKSFVETLPLSLRNKPIVKYLLSKKIYLKPVISYRKKSSKYSEVYAASRGKTYQKYFKFTKVKLGVIKVTTV